MRAKPITSRGLYARARAFGLKAWRIRPRLTEHLVDTRERRVFERTSFPLCGVHAETRRLIFNRAFVEWLNDADVSDNEIAFILGHEAGHVLDDSPRTRDWETTCRRERFADAWGVEALKARGADPRLALATLGRLRALVADHSMWGNLDPGVRQLDNRIAALKGRLS